MRTIIRRLQQAYSEPEVRKQMSMEDTIIDELTEMSRQVEKAEEEKEKAVDKAEKAIEEKEKALSKLNESAKLMKLAGLANNQIATATGLSIDVIEKL